MTNSIEILPNQNEEREPNESISTMVYIHLSKESAFPFVINQNYINFYIYKIEKILDNKLNIFVFYTGYDNFEQEIQHSNLIVTKEFCYINFCNPNIFLKDKNQLIDDDIKLSTSNLLETLKIIKIKKIKDNIIIEDSHDTLYENVIWDLNQQKPKETKKKFLGLF